MSMKNPSPQYCIIDKGQEVRFCGTRKDAVEFFTKYYPGKPIYYIYSPTKGEIHEEVKL